LDHIRFNDEGDGLAIAELAGTGFNPSRDISICHIRDEVRLGGVIFDDFNGESIVIHSAAWDEHWLNRDMVFVIADYPFNQLGVNRVFGYVREDNPHAISFNEKVGFVHVARIDGMFEGGVACLLMKLARDNCRFLNVKPRSIYSRQAMEAA
jgi:RimJ/RimL family protein N-acetyltransferase